MFIASYSLPAYFCRSSSILYCNGAHRGAPPRESPASPAASPLPQIKYGKGRKWKTPAEDFREGSPVRSRLKNFAKIPDRTGFCVDTENAAVWASASSAFSVSFLAKFCTSWNLRSSELSRIRRNLHRKFHRSFLNNYPTLPRILYPIFLLGNMVIPAPPAADVPSSFGNL